MSFNILIKVFLFLWVITAGTLLSTPIPWGHLKDIKPAANIASWIINGKPVNYCVVLFNEDDVSYTDEEKIEVYKKIIETNIKEWLNSIDSCGVYYKTGELINLNNVQIKYKESCNTEEDILTFAFSDKKLKEFTGGYYLDKKNNVDFVASYEIKSSHLKIPLIVIYPETILKEAETRTGLTTNTVLLHELGHAFGLCDEYNVLLQNCSAIYSFNRNENFQVMKEATFDKPQQADILNLLTVFDRLAGKERIYSSTNNIINLLDITNQSEFKVKCKDNSFLSTTRNSSNQPSIYQQLSEAVSVKNYDAFKYLLDKNPDLINRDTPYQNIMWAAVADNYDDKALDYILNKFGKNVINKELPFSFLTKERKSVLNYAILLKNEKLVDYLLRHKHLKVTRKDINLAKKRMPAFVDRLIAQKRSKYEQ